MYLYGIADSGVDARGATYFQRDEKVPLHLRPKWKFESFILTLLDVYSRKVLLVHGLENKIERFIGLTLLACSISRLHSLFETSTFLVTTILRVFLV